MVAFSGLTEFREARGASALLGPVEASKTGTTVFTSAAPAASPGPFTPEICAALSWEIHVQFRVAHVRHAGDSYTRSADTLVLLEKVPDELPEPQGHSHFAGRTQYQGPDPHRGP